MICYSSEDVEEIDNSSEITEDRSESEQHISTSSCTRVTKYNLNFTTFDQNFNSVWFPIIVLGNFFISVVAYVYCRLKK